MKKTTHILNWYLKHAKQTTPTAAHIPRAQMHLRPYRSCA